MFVLTVTPIDHLHKSDGPNGVKGAAEEDKYEIRLGEPNRPMSMGQEKVEPILCVEPLTKQRPRLAHHVSDS